MGKPAAREGDLHECSKVDPVTGILHAGGVIKSGNGTVLIGGKAAATVGDVCDCFVREPNTITGGSTGVFIGGKPAARVGDGCAHGGKVTTGLGSVLIGERGGGVSADTPSIKKKNEIIGHAIELCIVLLENKLTLLLEYDRQIFKDFEEWFGQVDKRKRDVILKRIKSTLTVCRELKSHDFELVDVHEKVSLYGYIYNKAGRPKIYLGSKFWKIENNNAKSRAGVIIHELSHFKDIGNTDDYTYGIKGCKALAKHYPKEALYNADSYELFITG